MEALSITTRPRRWEEIVGQDRAVRELKSILRHGRFLPKVVILEGPHGTGKTSTGYVASRAMLCTGDDPLGCGKCPSCLVFDEHADAHPEFKEIDAASNSGVDAARRIVEEAQELPSLGKTRVVMIDEAHRLSRDAWDVYLKPLEQLDLKCVFLFSTTDATKIPKTIKSRACRVQFNRVGFDVISGLLVALAARSGLDYEMDGLKLIARASKGHVRDALMLMDMVASLGKVTTELVRTAIDTSYEDQALNVLIHLGAGRLQGAIQALDEMARTKPPVQAVEAVFQAYGKAIFPGDDLTPDELRRYNAVKACFSVPAPVTAVLLKWSSADRIPADALPLFAYELSAVSGAEPPATATPAARSTPRPAPVAAAPAATPTVSTKDLTQLLGATVVKNSNR